MVNHQANTDFERARQKAFFREILSTIRRDENELIPYAEVLRRVKPEGESYRGVQSVPVGQIVGSVDRYRDFDREFLPKKRNTATRWKRVDMAYYDDVRLPPIQLYKVGDVYFVKDGNHRVSVAKERGVEFIDAEVQEAIVRVPLNASMTPSELLLQVEYAEFLRRTNLDRLRPQHEITPTTLGRYDELWDHILLHQEWMKEACNCEVSMQKAVTDWYDTMYLPISNKLRDLRVMKQFPDRSEADVYLWVMAHRDELERRFDKEIDPADSASDYAFEIEKGKKLSRRIGKVVRGISRHFSRGERLPETAEET